MCWHDGQLPDLATDPAMWSHWLCRCSLAQEMSYRRVHAQVAVLSCVVAFMGGLALAWQGVLLLNGRARRRDALKLLQHKLYLEEELVRMPY